MKEPELLAEMHIINEKASQKPGIERFLANIAKAPPMALRVFGPGLSGALLRHLPEIKKGQKTQIPKPFDEDIISDPIDLELKLANRKLLKTLDRGSIHVLPDPTNLEPKDESKSTFAMEDIFGKDSPQSPL